MRKIVVFAVAAVVAATTFFMGAPAAYASPACFGTPFGPFCDWVYNGNFSWGQQGWTFQNGAVVMPISDACTFNGPYVGQVGNGQSISQRMSIGAGYGPKFDVEFDLYLREDTENWWDAFNVIVKDLNTGSIEKIQYAHGSSFNGPECNASIQLSKNYSGHTVELQFTTGPFTLGYFQVDNVQFWSHP